ncbi:18S rRNA aminocarboxypropyltransferase [Durusdinium trenchii]|uniref:18S rRNA aminocarboxypropyltransferase n=1 Tax=Durusdinium trenchii TaxID=1381693 RepID=A0ABP0KIP1_9DINO
MRCLLCFLLAPAALGATPGSCGELCRRVRASAEQLRARQGTCGSSRPLQLQSPPSSLEELMVVFPVVRRARGAERQYVQRSASALKRELSFVTEVLVVGDAGDATATSLHTLGARIGTRARYQERAKHPELRDPSVLRQDFGDPLEKVLWRSRLVLDFHSAIQTALLDDKALVLTRHALWLEDDVELLPGFGQLLRSWLEQHGQRKDWLVLQLLGFERDADQRTWTWGTQGWGGGGTLLYNGAWLSSYASFVKQNFDRAPLDWLPKLMAPPEGLQAWWQPQLRPVLLRHFGQHSTHRDFW